jgi:hypothetical protein
VAQISAQPGAARPERPVHPRAAEGMTAERLPRSLGGSTAQSPKSTSINLLSPDPTGFVRSASHCENEGLS